MTFPSFERLLEPRSEPPGIAELNCWWWSLLELKEPQEVLSILVKSDRHAYEWVRDRFEQAERAGPRANAFAAAKDRERCLRLVDLAWCSAFGGSMIPESMDTTEGSSSGPGREVNLIGQRLRMGPVDHNTDASDVDFWVWTRALMGTRPRNAVTVPVVALDKDESRGYVMDLRLEILPDGAGAVAQHPANALSIRCDKDFRDGMAQAWVAALGGVEARNLDGCWSLHEVPNEIAALGARGPSATGAAFHGWSHAVRQQIPDPEVLVLAQLFQDGPSSRVNGVSTKVRAALESRYIDTIVVRQANALEATAICKEMGKEGVRIEVLRNDID